MEPRVPPTDRITVRTDARQFESFLRSINRCSSLLDARRLKNDITGEIRRTRAMLANHEKEDWINGEKTEDIVAFLDRLYTAKRKVEKRIVLLGGESDPRTPSEAGIQSRLSLRDVLTNPTSLSYFMEFMDRKNRSLLVQFWLTVESFKNPLESIDSGSSDDEDEPVRDPSLTDTLKEDISMMNELYFSGSAPDPALSIISQKHISHIRSFGAKVSVSTPTVRASPSNLELLMSPSSEAPSSSSRAPLFDDPEDARFDAALEAQSQRMEAIQAALTDIIALDRHENPAAQGSFDSISLANPGLGIVVEQPKVDATSDDEAESEERVEDAADPEHSSFQLAGPGDLHLSYEIERLGNKISNLQTQEGMLDTLIKKAELTGDAQELRLLQKSKSSLARELRELNFQKSQYEQQESANRLVSDCTKISIVNSTVADEDGKSVVRYLLEIQQLAADGSFASGWVVARRYNEFFNMHNKLRERYAIVRGLDFPGKRLVTSLSNSFVDSRRVALEKYMQSLIAVPAVCQSDELRIFLSRDSPFMAAATTSAKGTAVPTGVFPGKGLVKTVYRSVAESIDDMFFGPSMLDVIIQRLTSQAAEFVGIVGTGVHDEDLVAQALRASSKATSEDTILQLPGDLKPLEGETSTSSFSSPICDLILAIFELNKKNNWLRRQAIVIILQQVFGETIERKLRETVRGLLNETHLMSYIGIFRDSLWEGGQLKAKGPPRTAEEKLRTRDDANRKLSALIPGEYSISLSLIHILTYSLDLGANMIGRSNARRGSRRIFAVLQNRRLNQHLMYTIVDEVFAVLFPEAS
ncbi:hypothetical protein EW026_g4562 [Hermanssonia centrifuga]|uniref:Uncharacterized protein n=1 Tax=Hermanssonia centrifuga TaxID=98765 RepID=A0A4S4KGS6_9APHY|nr:hypothetical protein EW026_g4562 [Hermanssonia centrifuga]